MTRYLKTGWAGGYPSLAMERDRFVWLRGRGVPVPEVFDHGSSDGIEWLLTFALPGEPATAPRHLAEPRKTVAILAEGLRAFHEIDPAGCPFDHRLGATLAHIADRVRRADIEATGLHSDHGDLTVDEAFERLVATVPTAERIVLTHGDYCFPNVLIGSGHAVGYLDLGEMGLADRWRDLAVATWSVSWNVGPGLEDLFLEAYGAGWDIERRDFYRLMYDLES